MSKVHKWILTSLGALTIVSAVPLNAQECMRCVDDITVVPGQGITEWTHYFPGSSGEGGYECEDANEDEQVASFASSDAEEARGDHDGCHIDDGPSSCPLGHRLCFGGSQSLLRVKAVADLNQMVRSAERSLEVDEPEDRVRLAATISSAMNYHVSSDGLLKFSDCDGSLIASFKLSHELVAVLQIESSPTLSEKAVSGS